jgi:predicted TPR repeat methyltransferase
MTEEAGCIFNPSRFSGCPRAARRYQRKYLRYFRPGTRVLDMGCGEGVFLELLRESGFDGSGIDSSEAMVSKAAAKGLSVAKGDLTSALKERKDEYEGIFCSHVIEHLQPEAALGLLADAHEALDREGILVVITPNFKDIAVMGEAFWLDVTHVRPYPLPLLREMFHFTGFEIVASGIDRDSGRPGRRQLFTYLWNKLRFGGWYGTGDLFIAGRKRA